jgi:type 1 fimbria pilin
MGICKRALACLVRDAIRPRRCVRRTLFALALFAAASHAGAGTLIFPNAGSMPVLTFPPAVSIGRDTTVGAILASASGNAGIATSGVNCTINKDVTVNGTLVPGYANVYRSGVPGIGVHFYITSNFSGGWADVPLSQSFSKPDGGAVHYTRADLVVTGPVSSGVTGTLPSMQVSFSGSCFTTVTATQTLTGSTSVTGNTCSVITPALFFSLPRAPSRDLANVGDTTGDTLVPLGLKCPAGIKVYITITDAVDPANRSTMLSLAPGSSASGVAVEILNGSEPIAFGPDSSAAGTVSQWSAGTSAGGVMQIPLAARYVRTPAPLAPGTVDAKATFTMSYQ